MSVPPKPRPSSAGEAPRAGRSRMPGWWPAAVLAGGVALAWRTFQLASFERHGGTPADLVPWNVSGVLPESIVHALVLGFLAAALVHARRGAFAVVLGGSLLACALTGWPTTSARFLPRVDAGFAPHALLPALGVAAVLTVLVVAAVRGGRRAALSAILAGTLAGGLALAYGFARPAPRMPLRIVVRELLAEVRELEYTVDAPVAARIAESGLATGDWFRERRRAVITPATYAEYDVGDKAALLLAPGTSASFSVRPADGEVRFSTAVGASRRAYDERDPSRALQVRFSVRVDEAIVFVHEQRLAADVPASERIWRHLGAPDGIALRPGQRVTLTVESGGSRDGGTDDDLAELETGFADPLLWRAAEREREHASTDAPNVVYEVMDTLRADRTSTYGYARATTPALDRLAARGVVYEQAYSTSSWTWPSTASLLTGMHPAEHGVMSNESCTLARPIETVAEAVQRRGWTTGGFACNPLIAADRGYDQGFETFHDVERMTPAREVLPEVLAWIRERHATRFFLYLHLIDPHSPHVPDADLEQALVTVPRPASPDPRLDPFDAATGRLERARKESGTMPDVTAILGAEERTWISQIYDASTATGDRALGEVLDLLAELGLEEKTLVVFTSDHGEELLDHGFLAHGHALHEELVRVPLVLAGPGVPRGERVATPVSNRHAAATIAAAARTELRTLAPPAYDLRRPTLVDEQAVSMQTTKGLWQARAPVVLEGARRGDWKLVWAPQLEGDDGGEAVLFDLGRDPLETLDLHAVQRSVLEGLAREIENRIGIQRARRRGEGLGAGADARGTLADLGYTDTADADRIEIDAAALLRGVGTDGQK